MTADDMSKYLYLPGGKKTPVAIAVGIVRALLALLTLALFWVMLNAATGGR